MTCAARIAATPAGANLPLRDSCLVSASHAKVQVCRGRLRGTGEISH